MKRLFTLLLISILIPSYLYSQGGDSKDSTSASAEFLYNKLASFISLLNEKYVDKIDLHAITDSAINYVIDQLDPYSKYLTSQHERELENFLNGEYYGIGAQLRVIEDSVFVLKVDVKSPAERAGLHIGDVILKIDDKEVTNVGINAEKLSHFLIGIKDIEKSFTVLRNGRVITIPIKMGWRPRPSSFNLPYLHGIAYHKLGAFTYNAYNQTIGSLERYTKNVVRGYILDLRGNGGGLLDVAVNIVAEFLKKGDLILYTVDRDGNKKPYYAKRDGKYINLPIVVLIDENSASASEVVASALQDHKRATIIGRRSMGKGIVQTPYILKDKSVVMLATAKYYTPKGRSIQVPYKLGDKNFSLRNEEDDWGVIPNIYIPKEEVPEESIFYKLLKNNVIDDFAYRYVLKRRDRILKNFPTPNSFIQKFDFDRYLLPDFIDYCYSRGFAFTKGDLSLYWNKILPQMQTILGDMLYDYAAAGYYFVNNDKAILKAIDVLNRE